MTVVRTPADGAAPPEGSSYHWLGGLDAGGTIEPTHRVEGDWKEAWAERLARGVPPIHPSELRSKE